MSLLRIYFFCILFMYLICYTCGHEITPEGHLDHAAGRAQICPPFQDCRKLSKVKQEAEPLPWQNMNH